jgi:DNA-binding transcriptional ArsR family regulator
MNNQVFKALADPTRREILRLLAKGEMNAGELADRFDMTKPTVSHHFAVLREADLIVSRREGQQIIYSLNTTVAQDVLAWLWDLLGSPTGNPVERTIPPSAVAAPTTTTTRKTS